MAIGVANTRNRRSKLHECRNRAPRPPQTPCLKRQSQCKKERDRRCLKPLADADSAGHCHDHQQVHVRPQASSGQESLWGHVTNGKKDRDNIGSDRRQGCAARRLDCTDGSGEATPENGMQRQASCGKQAARGGQKGLRAAATLFGDCGV